MLKALPDPVPVLSLRRPRLKISGALDTNRATTAPRASQPQRADRLWKGWTGRGKKNPTSASLNIILLWKLQLSRDNSPTGSSSMYTKLPCSDSHECGSWLFQLKTWFTFTVRQTGRWIFWPLGWSYRPFQFWAHYPFKAASCSIYRKQTSNLTPLLPALHVSH